MGTTIDARRAQPFVGGRLKLAREVRGLTQGELVAKLGNSFPVDALESGKLTPPPAMIRRLALALSMPYEYFTNPLPPESEDGISFWCFSRLCDNEECMDYAAALCDYPLAGGGTCDMNMCPQHGKRVGHDRDYCWKHTGKRITTP